MEPVARTRSLLLLVVLLVPAIAFADAAAPSVSYAAPTIKGAVDAGPVITTFTRSSRTFLGCYERELASKPELAGHVVVTFSIDAGGKAVRVRVAGLAPSLEKCLTAAVSKLELVKPKDGRPVEVSYGITFNNRRSNIPAQNSPGFGAVGESRLGIPAGTTGSGYGVGGPGYGLRGTAGADDRSRGRGRAPRSARGR